MSKLNFFEDFQVSDEWINLTSKIVSKEEIIDFAKVYDPQPMHLDEAAGKASILGGLAASGWHTGALMVRMTVDEVLQHCSYAGSPGVGEVSWLAPVFPGDELTGRYKISNARRSQSRPEFGIVEFVTEALNQQDIAVIRIVSSHFIGVKAEGAA